MSSLNQRFKGKSDLALLDWVQEAKLMARKVMTAPINIKGLIDIVPEIRSITVLKQEEFSPKIKSMLMKSWMVLTVRLLCLSKIEVKIYLNY